METNFQIEQREFTDKSWKDLQVAVMEVVKSFPEEYMIGDINEDIKSVVVNIVKVPFYDGINVTLKCTELAKNISVDFRINDKDLPEIKKQEAKNLGNELGKNLYYSFSKTLHLSAKEGELKEKREQQLNAGSGIFSLIILIISIVVIFYSVRNCSEI